MIAFANAPAALIPRSRDYLSWSAITTFQKCPLKFAYRYLDNAPEESSSVNLLFGKAIHAGLERHFEARLNEDLAPGLDDLMATYESVWAGINPAWIDWGSSDPASLRALASRMFAAFLASPAARPKGRILVIEEEFRKPLIPGVPDLLGRIDLAFESQDYLHITDFKTSRSRWSEKQVAESSGQLLLYSQLAANLSPKPFRLSFVVLTKTKIPDVTIHDVPFNPQALQRTLRIIEHVWHAIRSQIFYPNPTFLNCPTCPFRRRCADWTG